MSDRTDRAVSMGRLSAESRPQDLFCDPRHVKATTATQLFRNAPLFLGLREMLRTRRKESAFTIWSAGCSSGEEAYSLAMTALHARRGSAAGLRIFGTDINEDRLALARQGRYLAPPERVPANFRPLLERFSVRSGSQIQVRDEIRKLTAFGAFDLRQRPRKHTFDLIVCNHVLQYYDAAGRLHLLRNLLSVLRPAGALYLEGLTPAERSTCRLLAVADIPDHPIRQPCFYVTTP